MLMNGHYRAETRGGAAGERRGEKMCFSKGVLVGEGGQVGTRGAAAGGWGKGGGLIFTSEFCKLVYHVSSCCVPPQTVSHHLFQRLRQFVSYLLFFFFFSASQKL